MKNFLLEQTKRRKNSNINLVHWQQARSKGTETTASSKNGAKTLTLSVAIIVSSLVCASLAQATQANSTNLDEEIYLTSNSFFLSQNVTVTARKVKFWEAHSNCDANLLSAFWGINEYEAKAKADQLLENGGNSSLETVLSQARTRARTQGTPVCNFSDQGYSLEDAQSLAKFWKTSVEQAKARVERKLFDGDAVGVREVMDRVRDLGGDAVTLQQVEQFRETHSYCDANLLREFWGKGIPEAKAKAAQLLKNGGNSSLETVLSQARARARTQGTLCKFRDEGYTYEDAESLAKFWKTSVAETKARVERKLFDGDVAGVKNLINMVRNQQGSTAY